MFTLKNQFIAMLPYSIFSAAFYAYIIFKEQLFLVKHNGHFCLLKNVSFWRESKSTRPHLNVLQKRSTIVLCNIPEKPSFIVIGVQELYR